MTKIAMMSLMVLGLGQATLASSDLVGSWKQEKTECKSGAAFQGFGGSSSIQLNFTEDTVKTSVQFSVNYDAAQGNAMLAQIDASTQQAMQMPDSPQKQSYLASLAKSKADILKYMNGFSCQIEAAGPYSVSGSEMSVTMSIVQSSCEGATMNQDTNKAQYEVKGDTLVITQQPQSEDGKSCPKGDSQVMTFSRVP